MQKNVVYCYYRYCSKLFSKLAKWGEGLNFGNTVAKIVRKKYEREESWVMWWGEKKMNFGNEIIKILVLPSLYQLWQPSCRNCGELRREKIWIVTTKLPKMGGEKKKNCGCQNLGEELRKKMLHPQYFHNKSHVVSCY